jgi:hypothetical protein
LFQQQHIKTTWRLEKLDDLKFGTFIIMKQINVMAFQFKLPYYMKIHPMFNVSLLEAYYASTIPRWVSKPPSLIEVNGEQEYEVEKILNFKLSN